MNAPPTKSSADQIVATFSEGLASLSAANLPTIRSVYLSGSYVRGDWLEASSDLDVQILFHDTPSPSDLARIKSFAAAGSFASRCPGGIDWSTQPNIPTTLEEAHTIGPFLYHSIFLFDLKENLEVLWGENVKEILPQPPEPEELSARVLDYSLSRLTTLSDDTEGRQRAAWSAYKATLVAQLHFGERTLSKWRILELFLKNVPAFPLKHVGEHIIRGYLGASYPDHPPTYQAVNDYTNYLQQVRLLLS
jgi:hypothetical protein